MNKFQKKVAKKALKGFNNLFDDYKDISLVKDPNAEEIEFTEDGKEFIDKLSNINLRKEFILARKKLKNIRY